MKALKRLAIRLAFSKEERIAIYNACVYSEHRYRKRGNIERAVQIGVVNKAILPALQKEHLYTHDELMEAVGRAINESVNLTTKVFHRLLKRGEPITVGTTFSREKCDKCKKKEDCVTRKMVFGDEEGAEVESSEEKENTQEQQQEASPQASSDNQEAPTDGAQKKKGKKE